jgi:hypothetical protein
MMGLVLPGGSDPEPPVRMGSAGELVVLSVPSLALRVDGLSSRGGWRLTTSLRPNGLTEIPAETSRVAQAAFPTGCLAMCARDELGALFTDEQFAALFAARGRPAWPPARRWCWCWEFVEGPTDRQAADAVRARLDCKVRARP